MGRLAAGLPVERTDFAVLPPHFIIDNDTPIQEADLNAALQENFPSLYKFTHLRPILRYSLASVIFHYDYLRNTLPSSSMLFQQPIFRSLRLQEFRSCVRSGLFSSRVKATGIPPSVRMQKDLFKLNDTLSTLTSRLDDMPEKLQEKVYGALLEHNALPGPASVQQVKDMLSPILDQLSSLNTLVTAPRLNAAVSSPSPPASSPSDGFVFSGIHVWSDGSRHFLPEAFDWPTANARTAFSLWLLGNPSKGWLPLLHVSCSDIKLKKAKKRLSDWRCVNNSLIAYLKGCNEWIPDVTQQQVDEMFDKAKSVLPLFEESEPVGEDGRRRRLKVTYRKVQTLARLLVKRRRMENAADSR